MYSLVKIYPTIVFSAKKLLYWSNLAQSRYLGSSKCVLKFPKFPPPFGSSTGLVVIMKITEIKIYSLFIAYFLFLFSFSKYLSISKQVMVRMWERFYWGCRRLEYWLLDLLQEWQMWRDNFLLKHFPFESFYKNAGR